MPAVTAPKQSAYLAAGFAELGVRGDTLSEREKASLRDDGFVILHDVLAPDQVARMRATLEALLAHEGADAGKDYQTETGSLRLGDLVNKDRAFDPCFTHPRAVAAVAEIIDGDFRLAGFSARSPEPGNREQAFHADWDRGDRIPPARDYVANTVWAIDDFTVANGATRIVPGSHRWKRPPSADAPFAVAEMRAGSVLAFNAYCWHSGGSNATTARRWGVHAFFKHREEERDSHRLYLLPSTYARLGRGARAVLDAARLPSGPFHGEGDHSG